MDKYRETVSGAGRGLNPIPDRSLPFLFLLSRLPGIFQCRLGRVFSGQILHTLHSRRWISPRTNWCDSFSKEQITNEKYFANTLLSSLRKSVGSLNIWGGYLQDGISWRSKNLLDQNLFSGPWADFIELLSTTICLAWNFFLDKNRITNQISICCILLDTGIQLLFAYPENHLEILLVIMFLLWKKFHAKQIFVLNSSMKLGPDL